MSLATIEITPRDPTIERTPVSSVQAPASPIARLEQKLDHLTAQLDYLAARQRYVDELLGEVGPIARVAMDGLIEQLAILEQAGYFAFGSELLSVVDRVVRSYSREDVHRLGEQIVGIVDTVRNLTQPDMLAMMNDVAEAVHDADEADPKGMWGMVRAGKDPEVRRGIGMLIAIVKQVGRAADKIARVPAAVPPVRLSAYAGKNGEGPPAWVKHLAPRRASTAASEALPGKASQRPVAPHAPHGAACASKVPSKPAFGGRAAMPAGYGADGFLEDPALWSPELARELAALVPLTLTDAHWKVLEWARADHATAGASPNVRRLSVGTGVGIRDLYALFPGKPGILIAMLAGIPKPAGCL